MTPLISRDELRAEIEANAVTVVDALGETYWAQRHLPGAIYLVAEDVAANVARLLPDRSAAIVTYCSGVSCPNSQNVATRLERLGYTNVRKYREGIEDWVEAGLPVQSAARAEG